jgi:hypothetical protein
VHLVLQRARRCLPDAAGAAERGAVAGEASVEDAARVAREQAARQHRAARLVEVARTAVARPAGDACRLDRADEAAALGPAVGAGAGVAAVADDGAGEGEEVVGRAAVAEVVRAGQDRLEPAVRELGHDLPEREALRARKV